MTEYLVISRTIERADELKTEWIDLESRTDCSYFQSWGWIGTWLDQVAMDLSPFVIKVFLDNSLVGIGVFLPKLIKRRVLFRASAIFLNEYPFGNRDMVIEYNGMLAKKGLEKEVYAETLTFLFEKCRQYDEFHFGAIPDVPDYQILEKQDEKVNKLTVIEKSVSRQVSLEKLEPGLDAYLASLSGNSRNQIRRSIRLYESMGSIKLREASSLEEALLYFGRLKELHVKRWHSKGEPGSFSSSMWEHFHRSLIQNRFHTGEIQLLKIYGSDDIAYLFNYVWRKRVYVLQMGFNYIEDKRYKPGYIAHTLAIVHNRDKGMRVYDFMHGESRYKKSLSDNSMSLYWVVFQRNKLKFRIENFTVRLVRRLRGSVNS